MEKSINLSENVLLVDAAYLDEVVGGLSAYLEKVNGRKLPKADMAVWANCVALDSGIRGAENEVQVVLIHDEAEKEMVNMVPSKFDEELTRKAFKEGMGEFTFNSFSAPGYVEREHFFLDSLVNLSEADEVKRIMVVGNVRAYGEELCRVASEVKDKEVVLFAMEQIADGAYRHDMLGFSVLKALGVNGDEL